MISLSLAAFFLVSAAALSTHGQAPAAHASKAHRLSLSAGGGALGTTLPTFASFNVDGSCNRGFHQTNFSNPNLIAAAASLAPAILRFGGSGNDALVYGLTPGSPECASVPAPPPPLAPGCDYVTPGCLNASHLETLLGLTDGAGIHLLFGVSWGLPQACAAGSSYVWNASNAQVLLDYLVARNASVWGMELGNEVNNGGPTTACNQTAAAQAAAFGVLAGLLDASTPLASTHLVGPDTGYLAAEEWLATLLPLIAAAPPRANGEGLLYGITHHVYNGLTRKNYDSPSQFDSVLPEIAWYTSVINNGQQWPTGLKPLTWAGENGPIGGGDDGSCGANATCGTYATSMWYADDMGLRSAAGFSQYQRQDLFGGAYGLTSSVSGIMALGDEDALLLKPDFWINFLWKRCVGGTVLNVSVAADGDGENASALVRAYAFAGPPPSTYAHADCAGGLLSLVLINLANTSSATSLPTPPPSSGEAFSAWSLSPSPDGPFATTASLNNAPLIAVLDVAHGGPDPSTFLRAIPVPPTAGLVASGIVLPALSTTFLCYH